MMLRYFAVVCLAVSVFGQESPSESCTKALNDCENDLECSNRLAPLMAACSTGTCQPQCRTAVLNVYQNKLGRTLLKSDATCIPGREELRSCNLLPTGDTVHCSLAKLQCEADLQCNSRWEVYVSECETESRAGQCGERCAGLLKQATATAAGKALQGCTCTQREDALCENLRDALLKSCSNPASTTARPMEKIDASPAPSDSASPVSSSAFFFPSLLLGALLAARALLVVA